MLGQYKLQGLVAIVICSLVLWKIETLTKGERKFHVFFLPMTHELPTQGIYNLLKRRMPLHADSFELSLVDFVRNNTGNDQYMISSTTDGKIRVEGTTLIAISYG
jgi:Zn-dependent protease with chaperone function